MGGTLAAIIKFKNLSFEESCEQLINFRAEFGHCDIPRKYSVDPSLGQWCWCSKIRNAFNQIKHGKPAERNLSE